MNKKQKQKNYQITLLVSAMIGAAIIGFTGTRLEKEAHAYIPTTATTSKIVHLKPIDVIKATSTMEEAFKKASEEFGVPVGLIKGIANAESGMGKYFAHPYDYKCFNYWGLKGGNMAKRKDGSYLRCFDSMEAGARTMAKTLKNYYLDEGRTTPEKIAPKWIGSKFCNKKQSNGLTHCQNWVRNVNKYAKS